jgi:small subunit ribosomal protein S16
VLEQVGFFNPVARGKDRRIELDLPRIDYWTGTGATMSDRVRALVASVRKQAAA